MPELRDEVLYDLTWNLAKDNDIEFGDSRERFAVLQAWTSEFQRQYQAVDWAEVDYLTIVDEFYEMKRRDLEGTRHELRQG